MKTPNPKPTHTTQNTFSEAPPDYQFTKKLPKQYVTLPGEEISLQCTVNNHRAPVRWFKEWSTGLNLCALASQGYTRTIIDALVLQWGQIKTRKTRKSITPSSSRSKKTDHTLVIVNFCPERRGGEECASTLILVVPLV